MKARLTPLLILAVGIALGFLVHDLAHPAGASGQGEPSARERREARRTPIVEAVERTAPTVVNISTERIVVRRDPLFELFRGDEFFERFIGPSLKRKVQTTSLGSGVIVDPVGFAVTNAHVVARASRIHVTLADGSEAEGRLVDQSLEADLALVRLETTQTCPHVRLGASSDLMIGETAIAVGNPFGLEHTVTTGVLSATNRSIRERGRVIFRDALQTDCAINPGNSGGPLLDLNGDLIGINTAIFGEGTGIGFAIPVDQVRQHLSGWLTESVVGTVWTGLHFIVPDRANGAPVAAVDADSPAGRAGLAPGDLVVAIDGRSISDPFDVRVAMFHRSVGDAILLVYERAGRRDTAALTLAPAPRHPALSAAEAHLGLTVSPLGDGVRVDAVEPDGPAQRIGMQPGDIIVRLGRPGATGRFGKTVQMLPIDSLDTLAAFLRDVREGDRLHVTVAREGAELSGEFVAR